MSDKSDRTQTYPLSATDSDPENDHHTDPDPERTDSDPDNDHHTELSMEHGEDDIGEEGEAASSVSEEVDPPKTDLAAATEMITAAVSSASASFINPTFFSGLQTEDPRDWITYLQDWIKYKNLNESSQARLLPLLFKDSARAWFIIIIIRLFNIGQNADALQ